MKEVRSESQMERQGEKTETSELEMEKFDSMLYPRANWRSSRITWIFGQHKKPFTDGVVVQECMSAVAESLLEEKQKLYFSKIKYFILRCTIFNKLLYLFVLFYF